MNFTKIGLHCVCIGKFFEKIQTASFKAISVYFVYLKIIGIA